MRRIFGPKWDENWEWRRLHNEKFHSLYRSPNIVRVIKYRRVRWAGHVARIEEGRTAFKSLIGKPTGKKHLGMPRRRWEDNIIMDLEEELQGIGLIRLRIGRDSILKNIMFLHRWEDFS